MYTENLNSVKLFINKWTKLNSNMIPEHVRERFFGLFIPLNVLQSKSIKSISNECFNVSCKLCIDELNRFVWKYNGLSGLGYSRPMIKIKSIRFVDIKEKYDKFRFLLGDEYYSE